MVTGMRPTDDVHSARPGAEADEAVPRKPNVDHNASRLRQLAYFYEPYWRSGAATAIKTLLLLFDGIALTVPDYLRSAPLPVDPALAERLDDQDLLIRVSPDSLIDRAVAESLSQLLVELFASDACHSPGRVAAYQALCRSRPRMCTEPALTDSVVAALIERGLAKPGHDGGAASVHPLVQAGVMVAVPHILRERAEDAGYALQPMTSHPPQVHALLRFLGLAPRPTIGHVVVRHLEQVAPDLKNIPVGDVLGFREEYGYVYRSYVRGLRKLMRDLAIRLSEDDDVELQDRHAELADMADDLRRTARNVWHAPLASCSLGIAGTAVPIFAAQRGSAGTSPFSAFMGVNRRSDPGSAYAYLIEVQTQLACASTTT